MKKLLYSMLIAFGVSACVESDMKAPTKPSNVDDRITSVATEEVDADEAKQIKSLEKTPITQAQFDSLIANTPEGQPVLIKRRSGTSLSIGNTNIAGYHPELLTFEFVECEFTNGIIVTNTFQSIVNIRRCVMPNFSLETAGVVQQMEIKRSTIDQLRTIDGSRCNGLTLIKSKIGLILNDSGGDSQTFRVIDFQ